MNKTHREILRELIEQEGQSIRPPRHFRERGRLLGFRLPPLYRVRMIQARIVREMQERGLLEWAENGNDRIASDAGRRLFEKYNKA